MKKLLIALICLFNISCALPAPEFEEQEFVPKKDIVANSIYQEGVDLYKAGRMVDAEMKMRQALYLFPKAENIRANLALVLKNNGLYEEADAIYRDLIKRFPEAYDYQFALAESLYREKKFAESVTTYRKAMLGYEKDSDGNKAAQAARSIAGLYFLSGNEIEAMCGSAESIAYAPVAEQIVRHVKLLLASNQPELALQNISPLIEKINEVKDTNLLKLGALTFFANNKVKEAKELLDLAIGNQKAGLKENDAELLTIREIVSYKYPEEVKEDEEAQEEEVTEEEEGNKNLVFNEQNLLYWPANLVPLYYEYKAMLAVAAES